MMNSRGMGDINPSKMGKKKTIVRKDNPNDVTMYKKVVRLTGFKMLLRNQALYVKNLGLKLAKRFLLKS